MSKHTLQEFIIFNQNGILIYHEDFTTNTITKCPQKMVSDKDFCNRMKTAFGVCHTLADVTEKISLKVGSEQVCKMFKEYVTNAYKLSFLKTNTGLHMIIISGLDKNDYHTLIKDIWKNVYIEYVCKNQLANPSE